MSTELARDDCSDLLVYGLATRDLLTTAEFGIERVGGVMYAASVATRLGAQATIVAVVGSQQIDSVRQVCQDRSVRANLVAVDGEPVTFRITGADELLQQQTVKSGAIVAESVWPIDVRTVNSAKYYLIYPVAPKPAVQFAAAAKATGAIVSADLQHDIEELSDANSLIEQCDYVFCNRDALLSLAGTSGVGEAVRMIRGASKAVFVVKLGMAGSVIVDSDDRHVHIPSFLADFRLTVGAGDAYDAAFLIGKQRFFTDEASAEFASRVAAHVVESTAFDPTEHLSDELSQERRTAVGIDPFVEPPTLYIAGHFHSAPLCSLIEAVADSLERVGFRTFVPHRDVGAIGVNGVTEAIAFEGDIKALNASDGLVALVDGAFRGGTFFEMGFSHKRGIPIFALKTDPTLGISNMVARSSKFVGGDFRELVAQVLTHCGSV